MTRTVLLPLEKFTQSRKANKSAKAGESFRLLFFAALRVRLCAGVFA
jgi:hypothetical protein